MTFVGLFALATLGAPLFVVMFLLTAYLYPSADIPLVNTMVVVEDLYEKAYLLPIPMFTLAGFVLAESRAPQRLVGFFEAGFGWLPGGLAVVTVVVLAFFTTFTGASGVTIIALGGLLMPLLAERKYPENFRLGLLTSSGSIGLLFFPSLPVFLCVTVVALSGQKGVNVTPDGLFLAGLIPGTLMVGALMGWSMWRGHRLKIPRVKLDLGKVARSLWEAKWEVFLPVFLLLLVSGGSISLNDVSVVTLAYIVFVEMVLHRDIPWRQLPRIIADAMALVGAIVVILMVIVGLNNYLNDARIPEAILAALTDVFDSKWGLLLALNLFLLAVGAMMDIFSALVSVLPLLIPLAIEFDIHPLHLCVIFLANLEVGYMTPPVGINLFISALHFKKSITNVAMSVLPFMLLLLVTLLLITYIEPLSTWLPRQFGEGVEMVQQPKESQEGMTDDGAIDLDAVPLPDDTKKKKKKPDKPAAGDDDLQIDSGDLDQYLDSDGGDDKGSGDDLEIDNSDLDQYLDDGEGAKTPEKKPAPKKTDDADDLEIDNNDLDQYLE